MSQIRFGEARRLRPHRDRVGVVDLELCRLVVVEGGPGGQQVEEHLQQVHVLPGHIRDLKDGTHPAEGGGRLRWIRKAAHCCHSRSSSASI